jgi:hypothetical protein
MAGETLGRGDVLFPAPRLDLPGRVRSLMDARPNTSNATLGDGEAIKASSATLNLKGSNFYSVVVY